MKNKNHPGVYIPPPLIYAFVFFLSLLLNWFFPLPDHWLKNEISTAAGWVCLGVWLILTIPALVRFARTKNTLITVKPASSLQTGGVYSYTRNPMYLGLLMLYTAMAFFKGDTWTFILLPLIILLIQEYVIKKEEIYLSEAFPGTYRDYCKRVRRWI